MGWTPKKQLIVSMLTYTYCMYLHAFRYFYLNALISSKYSMNQGDTQLRGRIILMTWGQGPREGELIYMPLEPCKAHCIIHNTYTSNASKLSTWLKLLHSLLHAFYLLIDSLELDLFTFTFTFNHLADAFIQSDVQMRRTIEAIRPSREQQYTSAMTSLN